MKTGFLLLKRALLHWRQYTTFLTGTLPAGVWCMLSEWGHGEHNKNHHGPGNKVSDSKRWHTGFTNCQQQRWVWKGMFQRWLPWKPWVIWYRKYQISQVHLWAFKDHKENADPEKTSTLFFLVCLLWCCFLFVCSVCHPSVCSWAFEDMIQRVQFLKKFWQYLSCHFQLWNLPSCFLPGSLLSFSAAQLVHCLWKGSTQGKALFQHSVSLNSLPPTSNSQMQYQQFPVSPLIEISSSPFFLPTILFARYLIKSSILFYKPAENKLIN